MFSSIRELSDVISMCVKRELIIVFSNEHQLFSYMRHMPLIHLFANFVNYCIACTSIFKKKIIKDENCESHAIEAKSF